MYTYRYQSGVLEKSRYRHSTVCVWSLIFYLINLRDMLNANVSVVRDTAKTSLFQGATGFAICDGSINSIGGDSFTARGDLIHLTINNVYPSSPDSSSSSLNLSNETQRERSDMSAGQNQRGRLCQDVTNFLLFLS